ncbi:hypothetical protein PILCRDRAFT_636780 [Piloderma croceum F 1598]|uniref:Uncharacterized protein n=1 Tax=Piloderma croceum (strain F 1598) TaxID=765440 RepID=A0A0C3FAL0_PILCF|nr:hypothetical protein PILCRDRAFT_636780 [Piloderma croceum F 1598]
MPGTRMLKKSIHHQRVQRERDNDVREDATKKRTYGIQLCTATSCGHRGVKSLNGVSYPIPISILEHPHRIVREGIII